MWVVHLEVVCLKDSVALHLNELVGMLGVSLHDNFGTTMKNGRREETSFEAL